MHPTTKIREGKYSTSKVDTVTTTIIVQPSVHHSYPCIGNVQFVFYYTRFFSTRIDMEFRYFYHEDLQVYSMIEFIEKKKGCPLKKLKMLNLMAPTAGG